MLSICVIPLIWHGKTPASPLTMFLRTIPQISGNIWSQFSVRQAPYQEWQQNETQKRVSAEKCPRFGAKGNLLTGLGPLSHLPSLGDREAWVREQAAWKPRPCSKFSTLLKLPSASYLALLSLGILTIKNEEGNHSTDTSPNSECSLDQCRGQGECSVGNQPQSSLAGK